MRKEASLPVRLHPDEKSSLRSAAEAMGMTPSALIRLLVRSFVEEYERSGGRISLPPRWAEEPPTGRNRVTEDGAQLDAPLSIAEKKQDRYPVFGKRKHTTAP